MSYNLEPARILVQRELFLGSYMQLPRKIFRAFLLLLLGMIFVAIIAFPQRVDALSKSLSKKISSAAKITKPGAKYPESLRRKTNVKNKKLQEEISEKALIRKPSTSSEVEYSKSTGLEEVDINPAAKTLLSILPKKGKSAPQVIVDEKDSVITRIISVKKNDTFIGIFKDLGYDKAEIEQFIAILEKEAEFMVGKMKLGQKFIIKEKVSGDDRQFLSLQIPSKLSIIKIIKNDEGEVKLITDLKKTASRYIYKSGKVKSSLVNLASRVGIPNAVIAKAIRVLSSRHNLSSQVRKGDLFEILYEEIRDKNGKIIDSGSVMYISLKGKIVNSEAFRYSSTGDRKKANYYDDKGRAFKKSILRNPLKRKFRISSGFGYRKHPILKKRILHAGTDFAAPRGTPIYAAGDGTISKIGRFGGYGNYIKIKHDSKWETSYGHLKKFAKGMRKWKRVKQGQLIGYVGSTGRSTGPHLHYEIIRHGKPVDSRKVSLPVGIQLNNASVKKLKQEIHRIRKILKDNK